MTRIKPLPLEFTRHVNRDGAKIGIIPAKILLRSLCLWPDSSKWPIVFVNWFVFLNLIVIEVFHANYCIIHYSDDIVSAVSSFATVTTTLEAIVRIYSLMFKKSTINDILYKVWKSFWPLNLSSTSLQKSISRRVMVSASLPITFLGLAILSNLWITGAPYIRSHDLLLNSEYIVFRWDQTYVYEILYVLHYWFDWFVLFMVNGFDFLFVPLVMICASQFRILQEVFKEMLDEGSEKHRKIIFGRDGVTDKELLLEILKQHHMLLDICADLENSFNLVILIQFVTSTMSICSSCLVLKLDSSQFMKMFFYATAHTIQLFYYSFVGQELTFQSSNLADSIYESNWQNFYDRDFRKTMIMMIQRSQRECVLTAARVTNLDFSGCLKVSRICFSFYTLFDSVMERRGL